MKSTLPEFWIARRKVRPPEAAKAMTVAIRTFLQQKRQSGRRLPDHPLTAAPRSVFRLRQLRRGARTMAALDAGISSMRAIRFIIMAVALPKGRFPGGKPRPRRGRGERYDQILAFAYPDNSLSRWGSATLNLPVITQSESPGWRKKKPQWRRILQAETGVQRTRRVCGLPFSLRFPLYRSAAETAVYS